MKKEEDKEIKPIEGKESYIEEALRLSSDELLAESIRDMLRRK